MKKTVRILSLIMTVIMMVGTFSVMAFADGTAQTATITPDTSWYDANSASKTATLRDAADLAGLSKLVADGELFVGWTIKLGADIVYNTGSAADWATTAPANVWTPIESFFGAFDGQGYVISGLYFNDTTKSNVGLFASIDGVTVKNVSVVNTYFAAKRLIGGIAGAATGLASTISNCYSDAIIYANTNENKAFVGGILGRSAVQDTLVEKCWFAGSIKAESATDNYATNVGGIVGQFESAGSSTVKDCLMTGTITAQNQVGGILGVAWDKEAGKGSVIENCLMLGTMELTRNSSAGMFFGQFVLVWKSGGIATVTNCYGLDTFSATIGEKWTGAKDTAVGLVSGGTIVSNTSVKVALANIKGDTAKTTLVGFDFDGEDAIWATVADGTPVLKALAYINANKVSGLQPAPEDNNTGDSTGGNTDNNAGGNTGDNAGDNKAPETDAPETDAPETTAPAETTADEEKGCGGVIGASALVIAAVVAGTAVVGKKREE